MLKSWKFWVTLVIIGAGVAALVGYLMFNKPHPDYTSIDPVHILSVEELYQEYSSDPVVANGKFIDQVIQVSGQLHSLESLDTTKIAVFVIEEGIFGDQGVRCTFHPDHIPLANQIMIGSEVMIKGHCRGYNETDVILEKCILIQ